MSSKPKPSLSGLKALLKGREILYSALREEQEADNRYYEGTDDLGIPSRSAYHEVRTGTARDIIEVPVRRLLGVPQDVSGPRKQAGKYIRQHTIRKQFLNALLERWLHIVKLSFKLSLLRGESYYRVLLDESRWGAEPERRKGESGESFEERHSLWEMDCIDNFPIYFDSPDPMNVYPSLDHDGLVPRDAFLRYGRTAGEVKAKYPKWQNSRNKRDSTPVDWVEYWSAGWRGYWADWEPVLPIWEDGIMPNEWGMVPYVHMWSGFGVDDPDGKPETKARGLLYSARGVLTALQRSVSFQDSDVALHSHRTGVIRAEDEAAGQQYAAANPGAPGSVRVETTGGPTFTLDEPPPINQALFSQSSFLLQLIEGRYHTALLSGQTAGQSWVQQAGSLGWARADYEDAVRYQEWGLSVVMGKVLRLLEAQLKKAVTIRATLTTGRGAQQQDVVLRPEDIDGFYTTEIKFRTEDKAASDIKKSLGLQAFGAKLLPQRTVLSEFWDVEDPEGEMAKLWAERFVEESPVLRAQRDAMAAREMGLEEAQVRMAEAERLRQMAPQPPPGMPLEMPQGGPQVMPIRQQRRGLEEPGLAGGPGGFPAERRQSLGG